jgi:cell division septation protein DedD/outer membrane protein assembly factor BamB
MELRWTKLLSVAPSAAPVHEGGRLFVARRDGQIAAMRLLDGEQLWEVNRTVTGQPAVGGGLLYVETSDELHGLDSATGQARWSIPLEAPLSAPLVWNSGWLIAALETNAVLALRAETGETIWKRTVAGGIDVAPALAGDRMYLSLDTGSLLAISLMTGATAWDRQLEGAPSQVLPLDALFVGATDNYFYRLSPIDGSIEWRWRAGGDVVGLPAVDEKRVYFSSLDNVLWALDRASGVQQWRQVLTSRPTAGPKHVGDLLAISGLSRFLTLFDPVEGISYAQLVSPTELAFPLLSVSSLSDGTFIIVVTGDGRLQAFGRAITPVLLDPAVAPILGAAPKDPDDKNKQDDNDVAVPRITAPTTTLTGTVGSPTPGMEYAIQLSALVNPASATNLAERLVALDYPAYVVNPRNGDTPALYRVRVGDYPNRPEAEMVSQQIATELALPLSSVSSPADGTFVIVVTGDGRLQALGHPITPVLLDSSVTQVLETAPKDPGDKQDNNGAAVPPTTAPTATPKGTDDSPALGRHYAIQVSALVNQASATNLAERLVALGYPAYVVNPRNGDTPAFYRVRIGDYPNRSEAKMVGRQIENNQALDWYVVALP